MFQHDPHPLTAALSPLIGKSEGDIRAIAEAAEAGDVTALEWVSALIPELEAATAILRDIGSGGAAHGAVTLTQAAYELGVSYHVVRWRLQTRRVDPFFWPSRGPGPSTIRYIAREDLDRLR